MGEIRQVLVPDIGDFKDVPIIEISVKPGDHVKAEEPLITLESTKPLWRFLAVERRRSRLPEIGDKVSQGTPIPCWNSTRWPPSPIR
jgi:pyruvate dehydrogenase E2 component (dihydrolipoamide acetyltransferase)